MGALSSSQWVHGVHEMTYFQFLPSYQNYGRHPVDSFSGFFTKNQNVFLLHFICSVAYFSGKSRKKIFNPYILTVI